MADDVVKLETVAAVAKCAVSTVSRALRDDPAISEPVKEHIRQVAESLNYRPLRRRRPKPARTMEKEPPLATRRLAMITLGLDRSIVSLPVMSDAIQGVEEGVSAAGGHLQIVHVPHLEQPPRNLRDLELDGVFLLSTIADPLLDHSSCWLVKRLQEIPAVWLWGRPQVNWGDCAGTNDVLLGQMAADYLIDRGHRHLAFVNPVPSSIPMMGRENGFLAQAQRRGVRADRYVEAPQSGWEMPFKPPLTMQTMEHLIDRLLASESRPTALCAAADNMAAVLYSGLARRGVRVAEQISIISGNNDTSLIMGLHPALTTFDVRANETGRLAVQLMMARLLAGSELPMVDAMLQPVLREGTSVRSLAR